jgi:hypothetical protein
MIGGDGMASKITVEVERIRASAMKFGKVVDLLKTLCHLSAAVWIIYIISQCIQSIVTANPDGIKAVAVLMKNMQIGSILHWVLTGALGTGMVIERRGRKRLLQGYAADRNKAEENDEYAPSSGLTPTGDTP